MGSVYEGTHQASRRPVAIKVLDPKLARHPAHLERFRREAEMTSSLGHPNVVAVEFFDHEGGDIAFYVMERLMGEPLSRVTNREGRVPPERAVDIINQTLSGLDAAHRAGVIHRDLKPSNIFLVPGPDGSELVKVVDFGLAKLLTSDATKLTVTGSVVGTPHYLSPEQALGQATDGRADLFACGVVLYELLAGVRPFDGKDIAELVQKIARAETRRIEEIAPEVPPALADAVHRALARKPADRFASAREMQSVLLEAVGRRAPPSQPRRKKSKLPMLGVFALALVLGAIVAVAVVAGLSFFAGDQPEGAAEAYAPPAAVTPIADGVANVDAPLMEPSHNGTPTPMAPGPNTATGTATPTPPAQGTVPQPIGSPPQAGLAPPVSLGIAECDQAAVTACNCGNGIYRSSLCQSAHEVFRDWRQSLSASPINRPTIVSACNAWGSEIRRVCQP